MIKEKIRKYAKSLGIEKIGFSKNAVVVLFPYYVKGERGNLSMYARGVDYHIIAREKLELLSDFLKKLGATETIIHADNGDLNDRQAAYDAGLGFWGKNGLIICKEYGSYFFIGQVVHNLKIEPDKPANQTCFSCGACVKNCPGGALTENGFQKDKCLSELTQMKGEIANVQQGLIKDNGLCWGCDTCQAVCPHNSDMETTAMTEFLQNRITELTLSELEGLSNKEFKEKYGRYAFSWRGKSPLVRNLQLLSKRDNYE